MNDKEPTPTPPDTPTLTQNCAESLGAYDLTPAPELELDEVIDLD